MNLNLDSHKLIYHIDRVYEFLKTGDCYPIYMEISPVGTCNHRCVFCAYDYIGYPNRRLDRIIFFKFIDEVSKCGLKSILFAGEGEPLIHPEIGEFINYTKSKNIDVGLFTNGELLDKKLNENILKSLTFIRFSINGGNKDTYKFIHKRDSFNKVIKNLKYCVKLKREKYLDLTIGIQFVLLPENIDSLKDFIFLAKDSGVDYLSIKPFVLQNKSQCYRQKEFQFSLDEFFKELESFSTDTFKVIVRVNSFKNYGKRDYRHCYGCNFITVLNSAGYIASCLPYWDKHEFVYGNIYENSFKDIWHSQKRKKVKDFLESKLDVKKCPPNCRPNAINSFLYELKHPEVKHINFI